MNELFNYILLLLLMAFPTVEETPLTESFDAADNIHSISMPSTVNADELLVILHFVNETGGATTTPTGWTVLHEVNNSNCNYNAWYKQAAGDEGSTTVDVDVENSEGGVSIVLRISGWNSVEHNVSSRQTNTTSIDPPSLSPTWGADDNLWIASMVQLDSPSTVTGYPANYDDNQDTITFNISGNDAGVIACATRDLNASSDDPGAFTTDTTNHAFSTTIAIEPGSKGAGGGTEVEAAFSLNTAPNVASSSQSVAEAGITINSQQGISDGSTATGESAITVSHSQQATTESTAQAESAMSLSSLLQAAFSKQSVTDASFTLPTVHQVTTVSDTQIINEASFSLALHKAITTQQISTIEVSYSLNTTQQTAIASDATGEAAMSMNLSAGLSLVSTALAEAGISFDAVQSMTITGQSVGLNVTLSDGRTLTITLQNRTFAIPDEKRTMTINSENRTFTIT